MIKSVLQTLPNYIMSCYRLPKRIIHELHQIFSRFWHSREVDLKKVVWAPGVRSQRISLRASLGIIGLFHTNQVFLAKIGWKILQEYCCLLSRVLKAKYFPNIDFLTACRGSISPYIEDSIFWGRELLMSGLGLSIQNGQRVNIWENNWITVDTYLKPYVNWARDFLNLKVDDLFSPWGHEWDSSNFWKIFCAGWSRSD